MAIKNNSNNAYTLKTMTNLLSSDTWSIDRALYFCIYEGASVVQTGLLLDKYKSYFDQYLEEVDVDEKFYYNPQWFAEDYYGDAQLDFLVLYFADMSTLFDFTKPKIKVLSYQKLKEINQLFTRYKSQIDSNKKNPDAISFYDLD